MLRESVRSSNIKTIGYDSETEQLEVEFFPDRSGRSAIWSYGGVATYEFHAVVTAESVGSAFSALKKMKVGRKVGFIENGIEHRIPDGVEEPAS